MTLRAEAARAFSRASLDLSLEALNPGGIYSGATGVDPNGDCTIAPTRRSLYTALTCRPNNCSVLQPPPQLPGSQRRAAAHGGCGRNQSRRRARSCLRRRECLGCREGCSTNTPARARNRQHMCPSPRRKQKPRHEGTRNSLPPSANRCKPAARRRLRVSNAIRGCRRRFVAQAHDDQQRSVVRLHRAK